MMDTFEYLSHDRHYHMCNGDFVTYCANDPPQHTVKAL